MKNRKRPAPASPRPAAAGRTGHWLLAAVAVAAAIGLFQVYAPALNGEFVFDDAYLPFAAPNAEARPLAAWLAGARPLLMFSFWINTQLSGQEPYGYHAFNVWLHLANGVLVFFILRRLLEAAGTERSLRDLLATFGAGLFLFHPAQTESVAYVASRSETLSVFFFYAAFAVFLYRGAPRLPAGPMAALLALFAAAVLSKEHTAVLPALLMLTDYYWNPPLGFTLAGAKKNWRLYAAVGVAGVAGAALIWKVLSQADSAGFGLRDLKWYEYFFTQCRVIWIYLRVYLLPWGLNADYDLAISRTPLEHGAILGLAGLAAAAIAAFRFRRRFPLASYGFLAFLLLLAPTSSFAPIRDPIVERRLYLPFIGLLLMTCEPLRRLKAGRAALAAGLAGVVLVAGIASHARAGVWSDAVALWTDTVRKSPRKVRPNFQLAYAYYEAGRCVEALQYYQVAAGLEKPDHRLLVDWALASDCAQKPQEALARLEQAAGLEKTAHVYSLIGMIHAKQGRRQEAMEALDRAGQIDPNYDVAYVYRGNLLALGGEFEQAASQFRKALELNPENQMARDGLRMAEGRAQKHPK